MGLLYYGQNFLIYPSAFPAGARESELLSSLPRQARADSHSRLSSLTSVLDVPVPTDFSIPYTDLELTTSDKIKIRAFLLLQRTVLNMGETPVEGSPSDEEVRSKCSWEPSPGVLGSSHRHGLTVCGLAANSTHVSR
jgi:hypothetical protein